MTYDWYEVWVSDTTDIPYVLLLLHDPDRSNAMIIVDPKEDNKIVHTTSTYEEAKLWLLEDEFTLADGRLSE
jgi:hypothetical protein